MSFLKWQFLNTYKFLPIKTTVYQTKVSENKKFIRKLKLVIGKPLRICRSLFFRCSYRKICVIKSKKNKVVIFNFAPKCAD